MGNGDRDSDPPGPPAWMKRNHSDEPYQLRRDPKLPPDVWNFRTGTSPFSKEDYGQKDHGDHHPEGMQRSSPLSGWRTLVGRPLPLETETTIYILISVLDIFVTWIMLRSGDFHERNPVARYFLDDWGLKGMIYYKFSIVAIVTVVAQGIALRKPAAARFVLILGSVVSGGVVVYSLALFLRGV